SIATRIWLNIAASPFRSVPRSVGPFAGPGHGEGDARPAFPPPLPSIGCGRGQGRGPAMATITYLTTIQFDWGAVDLLGEELAALGVRRPLLVTDPGLARLPLLGRIRDRLPQ